jgi:hydrophobic/amphiphilic exporter-1 (mainly G- bacteria), HAE1 family
MAAAVATPLEGQFSTIAGLDSMSSTSAQGTTSITLQFSLDRNIDAAAQDVQSAIAAAQRKLPPNMPSPPSFRKVNPADSPIFFIALSSPTLPLPVINEYAETQLAQRLSTVAGVAQVLVFGSQKYAVRIQANPDQLSGARPRHRRTAARRFPKPTSISRSASSTAPAGVSPSRTTGSCTTAADYRPLIVAWRNGAPIRLEDVAAPIDGVENQRIASLERRQARHRPGHPAPARAPTPSKPWIRSSACCPVSRPACRRRSA